MQEMLCHRKDVGEFQKQSRTAKKTDVKAWAAKTLPTLRSICNSPRRPGAVPWAPGTKLVRDRQGCPAAEAYLAGGTRVPAARRRFESSLLLVRVPRRRCANARTVARLDGAPVDEEGRYGDATASPSAMSLSMPAFRWRLPKQVLNFAVSRPRAAACAFRSASFRPATREEPIVVFPELSLRPAHAMPRGGRAFAVRQRVAPVDELILSP